MSSPNTSNINADETKQESEEALAPPSIPTNINNNTIDTKDGILNNNVSEPPLKRMKVDAPQIPHYNSHNIYSRPPAPPTNVPIPSLPVILPPVTPLDANDNNNISIEIGQVAPLPKPSEDWPLCAYCHKGGDLSRCSSCRQAYYCNRECQVAHWEVHCVICQPGPPQPPPMTNGAQKPKRPVIRAMPMNRAMSHGSHSYSPRTPHMGYNGHSGHTGSGNRRRRNSSYELGADGNKEQYYCEECDRYFKNGQALGGHRSRVHSSRRNGGMNEDGYSGSTKRRRPRPSRARHAPTGSGQYVCPHCGREFATGNALGGHISGAHTKKSKRNMNRGYGGHDQMAMGRYARPRHPNL